MREEGEYHCESAEWTPEQGQLEFLPSFIRATIKIKKK